jgi:hypothetical protein
MPADTGRSGVHPQVSHAKDAEVSGAYLANRLDVFFFSAVDEILMRRQEPVYGLQSLAKPARPLRVE